MLYECLLLQHEHGLRRANSYSTNLPQVGHQLHTIRVEMYLTTRDMVRLVLELLLTALLALLLLWGPISGMMQAYQHQGSAMAYFKSTWTFINLLSTFLMAVCLAFWWWYVAGPLKQFDI